MKCVHCNITIGCRTTVCPLCHAPFSGDKLTQAKRLPRAFPIRSKPPLLGNPLFDKVYFIAAIILSIVALITELIVTQQLIWFWLVSVGLFYIYFLIRGTIQDTKYFSQKVLGQAVLLSVLAFALSGIIPQPIVVFEYILPAIYLISMIIMGIYTLIRFRNIRKHLLTLIGIALLGLLPIIVVYEQSPNIVLAVISATLGGVILASIVIFSSKKLFMEIIRLFHI